MSELCQMNNFTFVGKSLTVYSIFDLLDLNITSKIKNPPFLLTANSNMAENVTDLEFCATPGSALLLVTNAQQ